MEIIINIDTNSIINDIKNKTNHWVDNLLLSDITFTKPGSISYLIYGGKPSEQSINIKLGRLGEFIAKELIKYSINFQLLPCGIQQINDRKKDIDLIFMNNQTKTIYYRELKGNIELDTEKLPATIDKCKEIESSLKIKFPDYHINFGILNWSVYNRSKLTAGMSHIKTFETEGVKIDHMEDFLKVIEIPWDENDFYSYFREIGSKIYSTFNKK